jgi:DNA-binding GntR family transcriptional regulator
LQKTNVPTLNAKVMTSSGANEELAQGKRTKLSSEDIYEHLKLLLTNFEIKPGERLNEITLSKWLNVSRTPLREVLNQLMVEGFLERSTNKGFICRELNVSQIMDLYEFRVGIETSIARLACQRATEKEIADLEECVARHAEVPENHDPKVLLRLDEEFHMGLAHMTKNEEYVRSLANINARIHFIRWIDMRDGRRPYTQSEHAQITASLRLRDSEEIVHLLEQHISRRQDQITEVIKLGFAEMYTREHAKM